MVRPPHCKCPHAQSLFTLLGKKWVIFILQAIDDGHHSFKTIGEAIGDANTKILTDRLEELTESGILERRVGGETPGAIRYHLTHPGKKLSEKLIDLSHWWGEARKDHSFCHSELVSESMISKKDLVSVAEGRR